MNPDQSSPRSRQRQLHERTMTDPIQPFSDGDRVLVALDHGWHAGVASVVDGMLTVRDDAGRILIANASLSFVAREIMHGRLKADVFGSCGEMYAALFGASP